MNFASHKFSDSADTNLTASANTIEDLEEILNNELDNVHSWLVANKLTLNVKKIWIYVNWDTIEI